MPPNILICLRIKPSLQNYFLIFFARKWISTENTTYDQFLHFIRDEEKFIYKPISNAQGQGIKIFDHHDDVKKVYEEIKRLNEKAILEQWITQHPVLNDVYSKDKPIIIEGNTTPGYRYYQIPVHMDKGGNRAVYEACLKKKSSVTA